MVALRSPLVTCIQIRSIDFAALFPVWRLLGRIWDASMVTLLGQGQRRFAPAATALSVLLPCKTTYDRTRHPGGRGRKAAALVIATCVVFFTGNSRKPSSPPGALQTLSLPATVRTNRRRCSMSAEIQAREPVHTRVAPETYRAIEAEAEKRRTTVSHVARVLLEDAAAQLGGKDAA
jgi:hypothetical protein